MIKRGIGAIVSAALTAALVGTASETRAQANSASSLQELVKTPQYLANIARLFASMPPDVFQRCPTLVSKGSRVTAVEPVSFAADGNPVVGVWKQSFPVSGCGNDTTINFFFKAQPDEKILSMTAAPGDTHAGLLLQQDAIKYVSIAVGAKSKGCSSFHLRTTSFDGMALEQARPDAVGRKAAPPWHETWIIAACGQYYQVPVTFIPDATGTTIAAAPATLVGGQ